MKMVFYARALEELHAIGDYYASVGSAALGSAFLDELQRSIELLLINPELGRTLRGRNRHSPLRRFPYRIIYQIDGGELKVLAIAHHRRRPGYWAKR